MLFEYYKNKSLRDNINKHSLLIELHKNEGFTKKLFLKKVNQHAQQEVIHIRALIHSLWIDFYL